MSNIVTARVSVSMSRRIRNCRRTSTALFLLPTKEISSNVNRIKSRRAMYRGKIGRLSEKGKIWVPDLRRQIRSVILVD